MKTYKNKLKKYFNKSGKTDTGFIKNRGDTRFIKTERKD